MTYLEALYGSQYIEIAKAGKDGNKGRLGGNLFLTAFIILCVVVAGMLFFIVTKPFMTGGTVNTGGMSGRALGKIIAIPVFALIYYIITKTVGSEKNFTIHVERFLKSPEEEKRKANSKILTPFFIAMGLLMVLAFAS